MPKYAFSSDDKSRFSLHDCRTASAEIKDGVLTFSFPDGIFCADYGSDWPNTGDAAVSFRIDGKRGVSFHQFRDTEHGTVREIRSAEEMLAALNGGTWELEFGYRYDGYGQILYIGWIWPTDGSAVGEFELFVGTKEKTVYFWNPPKED